MHHRVKEAPQLSTQKGLIAQETKDTVKSGLYILYGIGKCFSSRNRSDYGIRDKINFQLSLDHPNILATLPRSGYHWFQSVLTSTLEYDIFGTGDFDVIGRYQYKHKLRFHSSLGFAGILKPEICYYFHTHSPYYKIRTLKKIGGKKIVLIRHPYNQQVAYFRFLNYKEGDEYLYIKSDAVKKAIEFCNSWYLYNKRHPETCLIIKYEKLLENPEHYFKTCFDFFNIDYSKEALLEGIRVNDRKNVEHKLTPENIENKRITVNRKDYFSESMQEYILNTFENELISDFGYDLKSKPALG